MEKLQTYAEKLGVQCSLTRVPFRHDEGSDWGAHTKHYMYTLSRVANSNKIKGYYSQGEGIKNTPQLENILYCLLRETQGIDSTSFELWCGDFGYDADSRKAFSMYEACMKEYKQLKGLFTNQELNKLYKLSADC